MADSGPRRKLAAILAADVVGFSKLMGENEDRTLRNLKACRSLTDEAIKLNHGRIFGSAGDSVIAEFASPVDAVVAATEFQRNLRDRNEGVSDEDQMLFRVGLNLGDVIIEGDNLYGDGVNVAARLEAIAEPGGITLSGKFHDEVCRKLDMSFVSTGEKVMKNITNPIPTFKIEVSSLPKAEDSIKTETTIENSNIDSGSKTDDFTGANTPAIAVLPFSNISGDPEQEYFVDGITEDIISVISRYHWLSVIARNSTFVYKGAAVDVREVARELKVDYVLEGSVRKAGPRVRITAQLIDSRSGSQIWSERYDRKLDDIFDLQDEITETIAASIEPELARSERQRARRKTSDNLGAWDLFQKAQWHMFKFSKENVESAINLYKQAIALDEEFASAHAGVSVGLIVLVGANFTQEPKKCIESALRYAEQSVVLDDQDPFCHYALGRSRAFSFQPEKAEPELKRAIELNPSYAHAYHGLAHLYMMTPGGDAEVSGQMMNEAIRLSPRDPLLWVFEHMKGATLMSLEQNDEASEWMEKAARHPSAGFWAFSGLAACQAALGDQLKAEESLAKALEINSNLSQAFLEDTYPGALLEYKKNLKTAGLS